MKDYNSVTLLTNYTCILRLYVDKAKKEGILEKEFGKNKSVPAKRFPKEIFKPAVNTRMKVLPDEKLNLKLLPIHSKVRLETNSIHSHSSRHELLNTLELKKKLMTPLNFDNKILHSARLPLKHKSDQHTNLKRKVWNADYFSKERLTRANEKSVGTIKEKRLRTVQRTVHSSKGGTIKILLPINFIKANTKEYNTSNKVFNISSTKSPYKLYSFLNTVVKESKYKSKVNEKDNKGSITELCNVTFGMKEFERVAKQHNALNN